MQHDRRWRAVPALLAAVALSGCALLPANGPIAGDTAGLPTHVDLTGVPFFPQQEYQCGPAALAMVLGAAGVARTPAQLAPEVYLPARAGTLQIELLAAARRAGLIAYPLAPQYGAILREVAAGHPVVVLQNLLLNVLPRWHYAVVAGYERGGGRLILRSGTHERLIAAARAFDRSWARGGRWAFVALPPDQLPATAAEIPYVGAAAALERSSPAAARIAYMTALAKWPSDLIARIGLGNVAYGMHDLQEAQRQYRRATADHPESADAWNNLAQVLHESAQDDQAATAARRAIAIGGVRIDQYRATLAAIREHH